MKSRTLRRHEWDNLLWHAKQLTKTSEFWTGGINARCFDATKYAKDLRGITDYRRLFDVPELADVAHPTRFALTLDSYTGLATIFLA